MAESVPAQRNRAGRGRLAAAWLGILLFLVILVLLAQRLADGGDPGLRARAAALPSHPRRILVRRIEIRRVVHHLPASAPPRPSQATSSGGGVPAWGGAAVTRTS